MRKINKKIIFLGLIIVVLGLWINSTLGYQGDFPESYDELIVYRDWASALSFSRKLQVVLWEKQINF